MFFMPRRFSLFFWLMVLAAGFLGAVSPAAGAFQYDPDISGTVIDDAREPMEGVVVSAVWYYDQFRLTEAPKRQYYDYFETTTDSAGNFRIPGKGVCILKKIDPPTLSIFKAGHSVVCLPKFNLRATQDLPPGNEVQWVDGRAVIVLRKKSADEIKRYFQSNPGIPLIQMMMEGVPPEKVRRYTGELEKEFGPVDQVPRLQYKAGGVFPAGETGLQPKPSQ